LKDFFDIVRKFRFKIISFSLHAYLSHTLKIFQNIAQSWAGTDKHKPSIDKVLDWLKRTSPKLPPEHTPPRKMPSKMTPNFGIRIQNFCQRMKANKRLALRSERTEQPPLSRHILTDLSSLDLRKQHLVGTLRRKNRALDRERDWR
jgi:hypothetical protein